MALSTNFTTWVDYPGTPSTPGASDINRLQDNDRFLVNPPMAFARRALSDQSISHSTLTSIRFDTEVEDTDEMFFNGSSVAQFITIKTRGWYQINGAVVWDTPSGGAQPVGWRALRIRATYPGAPAEDIARVDQPPMPQVGLGGGQQVAAFSPLSVGTQLELVAMHSQGSTLTISGGPPYGAWFSARWVAMWGFI